MFHIMVLSERPKEYAIVISNVISAIAIDSNTFVVFAFHYRMSLICLYLSNTVILSFTVFRRKLSILYGPHHTTHHVLDQQQNLTHPIMYGTAKKDWILYNRSWKRWSSHRQAIIIKIN